MVYFIDGMLCCCNIAYEQIHSPEKIIFATFQAFYVGTYVESYW